MEKNILPQLKRKNQGGASREVSFLPHCFSGDDFQKRTKRKDNKFFKFLRFFKIYAFIFLAFFLAINSQKAIALEKSFTPKSVNINSQKIIDLSNEARKRHGLEELKPNQELMRLAEIRIIDMKAQKYFAHTNPQNEDLKYFASQINYSYLIIGENLAINYFDNEEVVDAWMSSISHRENILKPIYDEIGISYGQIQMNDGKRLIIAMILGKEMDDENVISI